MSVKDKKVIVAMSGGLDSSVAAWLLKKQGYEVVGVYMRLGHEANSSESAARQVAGQLGIKYYPFNVRAQFKKQVIDYFVSAYRNGLTPNPCIECNKTIKFGVLFDLMAQLEGDYLATGHYAKKIKNPARTQASSRARQKSKIKNIYELHRGIDTSKDQSYFLYTLSQEKLKKILFPLGDYKKDEIRKIADQADLPYLRAESQDVCFLNMADGIIDHNEFLKEKIKLVPGLIKLISLTPDPSPRQERGGKEEVIGQHQGLPLYTIGQRRGVEIGGTGPYYVAKCDYKNNTLYVVKDGNDPALFKGEFSIGNVNWISGKEPKMPFKCEVAIRYGHRTVKCKLTLKEDIWVKLDKPARAVTPGQAAVFYKGDKMLGGGIII